mmetsp:Transcript_15862/g.53837  ORF Transcript_15862/g.53837 Transcript_15862/m.53837 type:complete len:365 (+) Transcript_15862:887-1981(+)
MGPPLVLHDAVAEERGVPVEEEAAVVPPHVAPLDPKHSGVAVASLLLLVLERRLERGRPALRVLCTEAPLPALAGPRVLHLEHPEASGLLHVEDSVGVAGDEPHLVGIRLREVARRGDGDEAVSESVRGHQALPDPLLWLAMVEVLRVRRRKAPPPAPLFGLLGALLEEHLLGDPAGESEEVDARVRPGEVISAVHLHVGLLDDADPQFVLQKRERADGPVVRVHGQPVVHHHLACHAVDPQLHEVLARRVVNGLAVCLRVDDARDELAPELRLKGRRNDEGRHEATVRHELLGDGPGVNVLDHDGPHVLLEELVRPPPPPQGPGLLLTQSQLPLGVHPRGGIPEALGLLLVLQPGQENAAVDA